LVGETHENVLAWLLGQLKQVFLEIFGLGLLEALRDHDQALFKELLPHVDAVIVKLDDAECFESGVSRAGQLHTRKDARLEGRLAHVLVISLNLELTEVLSEPLQSSKSASERLGGHTAVEAVREEDKRSDVSVLLRLVELHLLEHLCFLLQEKSLIGEGN